MTVAIRPPAVAGTFYPDDPAVLRADVERMLAGTPAPAPTGAAPCVDGPPPPDPRTAPRALVLPHAGYVFSGPVAAAGYRLVAEAVRTGAVRRIVVIGPVHRVALHGVADAGVAAFGTPLGHVEVPTDLLAGLRRRLSGTHPRLLVTSPGVHRPLTAPRHWRRAVSRLVKVTLADGSSVTGRIVSSDDRAVRLDVADQPRDIAYADIGKAVVQVEFPKETG